MADGHTRRKLWHVGYQAPLPICDRNSVCLNLKKYYLKSQPNIKHSCTNNRRKKNEENDWLIFLLSFGLKQTISDPNQITALANGVNLLGLAKLDDNSVPFSFPKSVATMKDGQIIVCDTGNNRVIGFNDGGVQTFSPDKYHITNKKHQLASPLSVCVLSEVYIAVANYYNSSVNILNQDGLNESIFFCKSKPIALDSDNFYILYVLTEAQTVECYSETGCLLNILTIQIQNNEFYTLFACHKEKDELYLGEINSSKISVFDKRGRSVKTMRLDISNSGLNVFMSNFCYKNGRILVTDSINRSVYLFHSNSSKFIKILINGKNDLGSVQAVAISNNNKLITTEYSINQAHSVKIFSCNLDLLINE